MKNHLKKRRVRQKYINVLGQYIVIIYVGPGAYELRKSQSARTAGTTTTTDVVKVSF
jgi:hypothetical protein